MVATKLPLVCSETLRSLEESLDDERALCLSFVCRYIDMWPGRFERIHDAVTSGHAEDALDAVLSLRSSSMMVGAARLGELSTDLLNFLERGRYAAAAKKLAALQACGNQTAYHLTSSYVNVP